MREFLLLILLFNLGCTSTGGNATDPPNRGELGVFTTLETEPLEGELGRIRVRIRNATPDYLLLLDFRPQAAESGIRWQISRPGTVTYDVKSDTFLHRRNTSSRGQELFNLALLSPGEEISFQTRIRLLHFPRTFLLRFFRYDLAGLSAHVYMPEGEGRYIRLKQEELQTRLRPQPELPSSGRRKIIFPFAEQVDTRPSEKEIIIRKTLRPRRFSLSAAVGKLGIPGADRYTFFSTLGLWVIGSGEKTWLVSANRKIELPVLRNEPQLFHFLDGIDHRKIEVVFRKETKTLFAGILKLVPDPEGNDYLAFVPRELLLPFFGKVRDLGLVLGVELTGRGGGRLIVAP